MEEGKGAVIEMLCAPQKRATSAERQAQQNIILSNSVGGGAAVKRLFLGCEGSVREKLA